jgi:hypothetical protein
MKSLLLTAFLLPFFTFSILAQEGASCAEAVTAINTAAGTNTSDHSGDNDQWFVYTTTMSGKLTIDNCQTTLADTKVEIYSSCSAINPIISNDNYCSSQSKAVIKISAGQTYYIKWILLSGASTYTWQLEEAAAKPGDFCDNPIVASLGINSADHSSGVDQWYTYTRASDGKITISSCELTQEDTFIEVYKSCGGFPSYYNNNSCGYQSLITFEAINGDTYYIRWKNTNTSGSYNWTIAENLPEQGDFCNDPKQAVLGVNQSDHTSGVDQWFEYTATVDGEMIVESCELTNENTHLEVYTDCDTRIEFSDDSCSTQSKVSFNCNAQQTYLIRWLNTHTTGIYNWQIEENEDVTGKFCTSAFTAVEGTNQCDHSTGYNQWFEYSPSEDGKAVISNCGLTTENTRLRVLKNGCNEEIHEYIFVNDVCQQQESDTFAIFASDTYYIKWENTFTDGIYNWTLTRLPLGEGESCSKAITAQFGQNKSIHTQDLDQWFTYTADRDTFLLISSCEATTVDTKLQLYSDCSTLITESDSDCGNQATITYTITNGENILIRWMGEKAFNRSYFWNINYTIATSASSISTENYAFIHPNPNNGNFILNLRGYPEQDLTIKVFTCTGKLIEINSFQGGIEIEYPSTIKVPGIYIIALYDKDLHLIDKTITQIVK